MNSIEKPSHMKRNRRCTLLRTFIHDGHNSSNSCIHHRSFPDAVVANVRNGRANSSKLTPMSAKGIPSSLYRYDCWNDRGVTCKHLRPWIGLPCLCSNRLCRQVLLSWTGISIRYFVANPQCQGVSITHNKKDKIHSKM